MKSVMMTTQKSLRIRATLPGDKSISHRAMMMAGLSSGRCVIRNFLPSEDCLRTMKIFKQLGARIHKVNATTYHVVGCGLHGLKKPSQILDCGNSGTTMRLMAGILAGQSFDSVLTGDASLRRRPMDRITRPLIQMGAIIRGKGNRNQPPLHVDGLALHGITYQSPVASAQVKSAVLLAGLYAKGKTIVREPTPTRDHTERFFRYTGIPIQTKKQSIVLEKGQSPKPFTIDIPGDISSASFLAAAGLLVPGSRCEIKKVLWNTARIGWVRVLKRMGASIKVTRRATRGPEPMADLVIQTSAIRATIVKHSEIPSLIDELPILMVIATQARGKSWFCGIEELRVKETDRVESMVGQLKKLGARIGVRGNDIWVQGPTSLKGNTVRSFGDHRTAMSLIIAGMVASGRTTVRNTACIQTSFPNFLSLVRTA